MLHPRPRIPPPPPHPSPAATHNVDILHNVLECGMACEPVEQVALVKHRVDQVRVQVQRMRQTRVHDLQQHADAVLQGTCRSEVNDGQSSQAQYTMKVLIIDPKNGRSVVLQIKYNSQVQRLIRKIAAPPLVFYPHTLSDTKLPR